MAGPFRNKTAIGIAVAGAILAGSVAIYRISQRAPKHEAEAAPQRRLVISGAEAGYVDSTACAGCHRQIWDTYRQTGMGRSWARIRPGVIGDFEKNNTFYHRASDRYYKMYKTGDKYFQRRHQVDGSGKEINVVESEIDYVVGSGNHSLNYLHRTAEGRLLELPVAWYAEKGGYWAMNPGFDNPHHFGFRRQLSYECVFCHTGYPEIPSGGGGEEEPLFPGRIPEGIDCQRCHGPGEKHIRAAAGQDREAIRAAIVNPKKLSPERNLEVCMQCHLESSSAGLPSKIRRVERTSFSYRPGEPLGDFVLHFDHQPGTGHDDKFEIAHQAYRLRKSACFQKSEGRLTCTTCHNPHEAPRGEAAMRRYTQVCLDCHARQVESMARVKGHAPGSNCLECHMPKRRTDDVVHAVMTDHYIQRNKPARDLLAPLKERPEDDAYRGPVLLYYPPQASKPEDELYLAVAQVKQSNNLADGIAQLAAALQKKPDAAAEFHYELARAYASAGRGEESIRAYQAAIQRKSDFRLAWLGLGRALNKSGQSQQAVEALEKGAAMGPEDATVLNDLGLSYLSAGRTADARRVLERAVAVDPNHTEAYNSLGNALHDSGNMAGAEQAYRNAIRAQPDFAAAQLNLARMLVGRSDFGEIDALYRKIIAWDQRSAVSRYEYAMALAGAERYGQAREQFESATRLDPNLAEAQAGLADMLALQGRVAEAAAHYQRALSIKPELGSAHLGLAVALEAQGRGQEAIPHLEMALRSSDAAARQEARQALQALRDRPSKR